ncbi:hypothetical protein HYPSUDRAFT_358406 [Hypholoma sublateritium FD-334 SS-4]|uniref:Uncharacterized protein n=1 Tax=Hypholoma sublateritium (strain FD-334 SS-4) TaxID=945553 RepID=A0A0D2NG86_HYPSF|nr:hypothetical protein HYPSUDRAFT_358406 [Hypholoma sublateritium FD-334 SS-4]
MSHGLGYHEITLLVRYDGVKATQYFSKWTQESDRVFREDLTALRLPHPKRENTTFLSYGYIQSIWPSVPKSGPFLNQIQRGISPNENREFKKVCAELYITSCTVKVRCEESILLLPRHTMNIPL